MQKQELAANTQNHMQVGMKGGGIKGEGDNHGTGQ